MRPAPLRLPRPADLVGRSWWAFGFPGGDPLGDVTSGKVDASLGYGWIRLATSAPYPLAQGYSGAGLWSPDYEAVVGVVGQAHSDGGGRAISLHQADLCFPEEKLRSLVENWSAEQAGRLALASWGWSLDTDPEGVRHWRPRARGVTVDSERGYRFRGRTAALTTIVNWLGRARPDRRALVVTGSPGVGKSAVLGRIVTTADAGIRDELPEDDEAVRAPVGSVACAVHAKGKTALDVAREIARAASAALPEDVDDLERALQAVLPERSRRFNVVIDALDEVTSPTEARTIITHVVLPIVETCAELGAQVVIATRRRDDGGDLLGVFSGAASIVDLDEPAYFAREDLVEYAMATLRLVGDERPDNPYQPEQVARPVAEAIAARSERNFLIAGLVARTHGMHDQRPVEAASLSFTATVEEALRNYVSRLPNVDALPASSVLTALAFAESPGFDLDLWRLAILALDGASTTTGQLARFARSSAANFLVESTFGEHGGVYRLFHQALNDALRAARSPVRPRAQDEGALARAFLSHAHKITWEHAPPYLLRSLAGHAARGGVLEELLTDAEYLLHADLHHLASYAIRASSPYVRARGRLIQLTPSAQEAPPHVRAALFSVTSAVARLDVEIPDPGRPAPYRAAWATVMPRADEAVLEGHTGTVNDVCAFTLGGRTLLASAGADRAVRIWNPADGQAERVMTGHTAGVTKVRAFALDGRLLLATASEDGTIRIWDPATGLAERTLAGHTGPVTDVCAFTVEGRTLLASTGGDGSVRVWDPALGRVERHLSGHRGAPPPCASWPRTCARWWPRPARTAPSGSGTRADAAGRRC
ncbi:NACHT and WD repeat domain-containing protein [Thermocatellispora tengchongensis]|uniref:NACHT and WD repeat domain-containing protein n=1 Tax=Thermocatellispora tengchongensis TaxID=1073253 RepID=UPI003626D42C